MCGIIGYVGKKSASPILLEGLRRLEYRGYDSAGVAVLRDADISVRKKQGKISEGLARLVDAFAKRLQIQEKMTVQIADTLNEVLQPKGVGVILEASHQCMSTRGVHKAGVEMVTSRMLGTFRTDPSTRREFLSIVHGPTSVSVANT